ncbi:hypothetical protein F7725_027367 [Dissostichus mawsoni]|uniref:Uncharacterized protein n=1 Tax=Dissostichus mawsoni TaxID=36200 RepID=A0A7J5XDM4_DISMA|nr:hypothetical protein F7725_027367 [Dissostichus mawsoni]
MRYNSFAHLAIPPRAMWLWPGMAPSLPGARSKTSDGSLEGAAVLLVAQLLLLSSQLVPLPHDALLLAPPLVLDAKPLSLQELTLHALCVQALLLNLRTDPLALAVRTGVTVPIAERRRVRLDNIPDGLDNIPDGLHNIPDGLHVSRGGLLGLVSGVGHIVFPSGRGSLLFFGDRLGALVLIFVNASSSQGKFSVSSSSSSSAGIPLSFSVSSRTLMSRISITLRSDSLRTSAPSDRVTSADGSAIVSSYPSVDDHDVGELCSEPKLDLHSAVKLQTTALWQD